MDAHDSWLQFCAMRRANRFFRRIWGVPFVWTKLLLNKQTTVAFWFWTIMRPIQPLKSTTPPHLDAQWTKQLKMINIHARTTNTHTNKQTNSWKTYIRIHTQHSHVRWHVGQTMSLVRKKTVNSSSCAPPSRMQQYQEDQASTKGPKRI